MSRLLAKWFDEAGVEYQVSMKDSWARLDDTAKLYEELRSIIDGGSESFTHEDAVQYLKEMRDWEAIAADQAMTIAMMEIEQEPVAWLVTGENINALQVASIQRVIDRLKHAHHTDLCLRINGQDERFEADWIKHLQRATSPPQRKPLTEDEIITAVKHLRNEYVCSSGTLRRIARAIEAALKEKNT